ncbi:MAG: nicotinate phosphoribosyltransferase [Firmicutes bacterium HGW-Firmicutes-11]|nr:MAG: nicotinate phosphoribosyltransferase [Firmicutes bacterium HGW-Firmicutes-11]
MERINMTMLTDFYELTMANGYLEKGMQDQIAYFDMFFRKIPDGGGFAITAGLEQLIRCLQTLKFEEEDIVYLRKRGIFCEEFLEYLRNFKFECDVWAIPEGTPVFPSEPLVTVRGPVIQSQFIETILLLLINHQSLIATKANRIVRAAEGRGVMEFGTRRAHGASSAIYGARAAYIGGCIGTACAIADREFGIPALGTMAHSWVQMFDSEYESFKAYAEIYPENCTLLVDTYNTLKSGVPNAIRVFKEQKPQKMAIRIDSGDVTYLTKKSRKMLDEAGLTACSIVVSNSFDEYLIRNVIDQGAEIDVFGVGERLITARSEPVFGGVYKMAALEKNGEIIPKIKISENVEKITNPGFKTAYRFFDKDSGKALADVITLADEVISTEVDYEIFDPQFIWKRKTITNFNVKKLQERIFDKGELVYKMPSINEIKQYCKEQIDTLWEEVLRFENPHEYFVDLSEELWTMKIKLIDERKDRNLVK